MKKTIRQLFCLCLLLTVLSINAFSGDAPNGGKSCQTSSPCLVSQIEVQEEITIEKRLLRIFESLTEIFQ